MKNPKEYTIVCLCKLKDNKKDVNYRYILLLSRQTNANQNYNMGYEKSIEYARVAQFGRAVPSYGKGHRFKSCLWYSAEMPL